MTQTQHKRKPMIAPHPNFERKNSVPRSLGQRRGDSYEVDLDSGGDNVLAANLSALDQISISASQSHIVKGKSAIHLPKPNAPSRMEPALSSTTPLDRSRFPSASRSPLLMSSYLQKPSGAGSESSFADCSIERHYFTNTQDKPRIAPGVAPVYKR